MEPKSILGHSAVKGEQANNIPTSVKRNLLGVRIGQSQKTVNTIKAVLTASRRDFRFAVDEET